MKKETWEKLKLKNLLYRFPHPEKSDLIIPFSPPEAPKSQSTNIRCSVAPIQPQSGAARRGFALL